MSIAENISPQREAPLETALVLCAEETTRDAIAYWLSFAHTQALVPADGYEADRILKSRSCRLLITDRILPPWPGLETFMTLRQAYPQLRIVFVDNGSPDARSLAQVTGAHTVLQQPLTRKALFAVLPKIAATA